jgi:hypothetical protein
MADDHEIRIAALEARVELLEALMNASLRLSAADKPLSTLLTRFGASEPEILAVHALLDDVAKRVQAGGIYTPSFTGFLSDLVKVCPLAKNNRDFVLVLLETLKLERPAYQELHAFATARGWPDRR